MSYVSAWDDKYICRQRWNARRCLCFPTISQKEVHTAVMVLSSTTDLFFSSFTVASDGFICSSHLVLRSIINLFHTHSGRKSYLMFYFTVSWGFPSDLGFLCSARHLCVSLALSVSALSVRLFREGATVDVVLLFVMWECGGDFIFAWRRGETLFVDSDFWFILPVFLNLTKS